MCVAMSTRLIGTRVEIRSWIRREGKIVFFSVENSCRPFSVWSTTNKLGKKSWRLGRRREVVRTEPWTDVDDEATVRTHTIRHTHEMSCSSPGEGRINQKRKKISSLLQLLIKKKKERPWNPIRHGDQSKASQNWRVCAAPIYSSGEKNQKCCRWWPRLWSKYNSIRRLELPEYLQPRGEMNRRPP